jgi:hypothetical protein
VLFRSPVLSSPNAGTYGATQRMLERLRRDVELTETQEGDVIHYTGMDGQIDFHIHTNPENVILHTVLVGEMNGFIYAVSHNTPFAGLAGTFSRGRAYGQFIQEGE